MAFIVPERNAVVVPRHQIGLDPGRNPYLVYPYELDTFQMLRDEYGIRLPGPIRTEYEFKSRFPSPFDHQIVTADFLTQKQKAFVFNDIGTAKTLSALWAADYLMRIGKVRRVLICSTLSTLQKVWGDEIFKSFYHRNYVVLHGSKAKRLKKLAEPFDFYIINHDGLKVLTEWDRSAPERAIIKKSVLDHRPDIDLVIVDECSQFRNKGTDRYRALNWIASPRRLWMLSGSPMPRAPTDIWAQAQLVCPKAVDRSFVRFRDRVMLQVNKFKWIPSVGWEDTIYKILRHECIRYTRDKCLDLPPCTTTVRQVSMSKQQIRMYDSMKKEMVIQLKDHQITAANEAVKLNKLLQISCGVVYGRDGAIHLDCAEKLADLKVLVEESGKKLIVYAPFKAALDAIYKTLERTYKVTLITGETSLSKRNDCFQQFQHGDLEVIVAHPKCMAHGVDLTRSNTIAWWSPVDDFDIYEQASARITRPGQTSKQTVIHMVCSEAEARVYKRLETKESMQGLLLELLTAK